MPDQHVPSHPMYRLFSYLDSYRRKLWTAITDSVINKLFDLMPPFLTAWFIDSVSGKTPAWISSWTGYSDTWSVLIFLAILTFVIFGFESFFEWRFKLGFMKLAQRVQHDLRVDAYQKLQSREMAYFENQRTGNLMAMLNDDVNQLERFLNNSFKEIIHLITLVIFAGWSLLQVNFQLGLLGMIPIPLIILASFYYQKKVAPYYTEVRSAVGQLSTRLENNISGIQVIKSFTAELFETTRVEESSRQYRDANFKAIHLSARFIPLIRMLIAIGFTGTLLLGAYWVMEGKNGITLGHLAFFAMMIQRLLWPVTTLGRVFDEYERARASARRIFTLLDSPTQIKDPEQPRFPAPFRGNLSLENVSFDYRNDIPVLHNISLDIPSGQTIGIAGPTGAGKTTLVKLLLRLYDPSEGRITIDQIDIRDMRLRDLRHKIGLVSQEVYLFHGTVRENIAYGIEDCPEEKIIDAAKKAQLHEFISRLPEGYEAIIGERGIKLSGGQRQRLSIARAILKDAPIMLLDEATSAVDTETEKAIQENLHLLTTGKTAIIIAHRLSTIRHADRIIVLQDGQIVEQGAHEELVEHGGVYGELWGVQVGEV